MIYASIGQSESGVGLYRSTNFGDNWSLLSSQDYFGVQGFYSHWVHVDPNDSSVVLTGGIDIWRSTQGGRNLVKLSNWSAWFFGNVPPGGPEGPANYAHADHHAVIYDPTKPDTLYFACDGGVFRTFDRGTSFAGVNGGYQSTQFYNGFTNAILQPNLAIGGMQDNATAIYEGNLGWRRVIGGDGCWTAMHPTNPQLMYGESQYLNIQRSTNGGTSWNNATTGISQTGEVAFVAPFVLSPVLPGTMYAGRSRIFRTTNGGTGWTATNGNLELDTNPALSMAISNTSDAVVYVGTAPVLTRSGVFVTTNSGSTWANITGTLPDRYPVDIAVDPFDDQIAYVVMSGFGSGHLFRTTNRGSSWTDITNGLPDLPSSAVMPDPDFPQVLYFGNDIGVYVSTNNGGTWQEYQTGMPDAAIVMDLVPVRTTRYFRAVTHGRGVYERPMLDPSTGVADGGSGAPAAGLQMLLTQPNPFRDATNIRFALGVAEPVTVRLYDVTGRAVATLLNSERRAAGEHMVHVDARRLQLAAGVYVARIEAGREKGAVRLVLAP